MGGVAIQDAFTTARLRRELPKLAQTLGRPPTRAELAERGFDGALLKRLETAGILTSRLMVIDGSGSKRRGYSLARFRP